MKYSDLLVERVLTLGGLPNMNEIGTLRIGNDVYSILQCDLEVQKNGIAIFAHAIGMCEAKGDKESADILRDINDSKHKRIEFIETQLKSIDTIGLDKYLQSQV
jgi:bacterioferritin